MWIYCRIGGSLPEVVRSTVVSSRLSLIWCPGNERKLRGSLEPYVHPAYTHIQANLCVLRRWKSCDAVRGRWVERKKKKKKKDQRNSKIIFSRSSWRYPWAGACWVGQLILTDSFFLRSPFLEVTRVARGDSSHLQSAPNISVISLFSPPSTIPSPRNCNKLSVYSHGFLHLTVKFSNFIPHAMMKISDFSSIETQVK